MTTIQEDIIKTCRILVRLNLDSGPFGNISIRIPGKREFWHTPEGIYFNNLQIKHLSRMSLEGEILEGDYPVHPGENIHRQIYKLRPDINAVVHTHSEATVLFSLLGQAIEPHTQLGASFYNDQSLYQSFSGPVRDADEGLVLATALGDKSLLIAKNHGLFATGQTIQAALGDMIISDMAANIHLQALRIGITKASLSHEFDFNKSRTEVRNKQYQSMWNNF